MITCALALLSLAPAAPDPTLARRYFQEIKWISADDAGALWGKPIDGPLVFVDQKTRESIANQTAPDFVEQDGLYIGRMPDGIPLANTAFVWGGQRWSMVLWPPPSNRAERATLLIHELFHRIQSDLGIPGSSPPNAQMETTQGRIWLQLELSALADALQARNQEDRERHAAHALAFRAKRHRLFPNAKKEEDQLELNEGLAEFTGQMMRGGWEPESRFWVGNQCRAALGADNYARRFAYQTGSAYALLINVTEAVKFDEIRWKKAVNADFSLSAHLAGLLSPPLDQTDDQLASLAAPYGYSALVQEEGRREGARLAKIAEIKKLLVDGPVLVLPLQKMRTSFNPRAVVTLADNEGVYHPVATVMDEWGSIEVTQGVLIAGDYKHAYVSAPASIGTEGPGWKITLKPGWKMTEGKRKGDFTLVPPG